MSDPTDLHPLWLGLHPLILASGSATRLALLTAAGIPCEVIRPAIDERAIAAPLEKRSVSAEQIAVTLATEKALSVAQKNHGRYVLGADQTLACDGVLLHKPKDRASAAGQLAFLSGKTHHLFSAVALVFDHQTIGSFVAVARLTMRPLSSDMIDRYLDASGPAIMDSVGGYQLEKTGVHLFSRISGDHTTILGLPMVETLARLRQQELVVA